MGVPGGEITIHCRGFRPGLPSVAGVLWGNEPVKIVSASEDRVIARLPDSPQALGLALSVNGEQSPVFPFAIAQELASGLHPVGNPAVSSQGDIITTISGTRGQQISQPLIRVTKAGERKAFPCEIMNPTGLAFGPDDQLYVSSRSEGVIFRYADFETLEVVAEDLGVCCGIIFDPEGVLYAGDRNGKIFRIDPSGECLEFASLEPSVSAYHLAMDEEGNLYVTGPTLAMRDSLYRISPDGQVGVVRTGFARPQGLAMGPDGSLWVAAAFEGQKGVFRIDLATKKLEHSLAAPTLVGLAFDGEDMFLADNSSIFWLKSTGGSRSII